MEKELSKNLLVWGSTIIVIQNIILIPSFILAYTNLDSGIGDLAFTPAFWIDLIGFSLIGAGMYFIGDFYTSVASFTKGTAQVAFIWVILSALWRLMFGILIPIVIPLGIPMNFGIPHIIFGIASVAFLILMIFINQVMNAFQEQESIGKGGSTLFTVFAIIHIIGTALIFLGSLSTLGLSDDTQWYSTNYLSSVLLGSLGFLLKLIVVPIMGIITFLGVRNRFQSIED
ncbi:MAG: hypothetical protein ACXACK_18575 [Candidatus Hodarchaeales archaeon]|jgi:hypothetical protein